MTVKKKTQKKLLKNSNVDFFREAINEPKSFYREFSDPSFKLRQEDRHAKKEMGRSKVFSEHAIHRKPNRKETGSR